MSIFQFTPLREGRHARAVQPPRRHNFNSRPSARGDVISRASDVMRKFQFTPLREGRPGIVTLRGITNDFNSRPSARGDLSSPCFLVRKDDFNSRPSARGDPHCTY